MLLYLALVSCPLMSTAHRLPITGYIIIRVDLAPREHRSRASRAYTNNANVILRSTSMLREEIVIAETCRIGAVWCRCPFLRRHAVNINTTSLLAHLVIVHGVVVQKDHCSLPYCCMLPTMPSDWSPPRTASDYPSGHLVFIPIPAPSSTPWHSDQ